MDDISHIPIISIETSINLGDLTRPRVSPRSPVLLPPVVAASEHRHAAHGNGPARLRPVSGTRGATASWDSLGMMKKIVVG